MSLARGFVSHPSRRACRPLFRADGQGPCPGQAGTCRRGGVPQLDLGPYNPPRLFPEAAQGQASGGRRAGDARQENRQGRKREGRRRQSGPASLGRRREHIGEALASRQAAVAGRKGLEAGPARPLRAGLAAHGAFRRQPAAQPCAGAGRRPRSPLLPETRFAGDERQDRQDEGPWRWRGNPVHPGFRRACRAGAVRRGRGPYMGLDHRRAGNAGPDHLRPRSGRRRRRRGGARRGARHPCQARRAVAAQPGQDIGRQGLPCAGAAQALGGLGGGQGFRA